MIKTAEEKRSLIYKVARIFYRGLFINPKYLFGPIGFFQKIKIDFYELCGKKQFIVNYGKNLKFYNHGLKSLGEKNGFKRMTELDNILDLGGFIGDSAILLANQNEGRVFVFEPEKEKFKWILENIRLNDLREKIKAFNYAVIANDVKELEFNKLGDFSPGSSTIKNKSLDQIEVVRCINIKEVMGMADFDGLKCDIEGGEFEVIDYFLKNPHDFKFKKGIIEWHFNKGNLKQTKTLLDFLSYLKKEGYSFSFYPVNKPSKILDEKEEVENIVQQKFERGFYDHINEVYVNLLYFYKDTNLKVIREEK